MSSKTMSMIQAAKQGARGFGSECVPRTRNEGSAVVLSYLVASGVVGTMAAVGGAGLLATVGVGVGAGVVGAAGACAVIGVVKTTQKHMVARSMKQVVELGTVAKVEVVS